MAEKEKENMLEKGKHHGNIDLKKMDTFYKAESFPEKKKAVRSRCARIVVWSLIIFNVLLLIALFGLVIGWRELRKNSMAPHEQTVCLNCTEMGLDSNELPEEVKGKISREQNSDGHGWVCCGHTSDVLNRLVEKAIKDRGTGLRSSLYPLISKECKKTTQEKPSAQVNGVSMSEMSKGHRHVIQWNTTETSFLKGGITYKKGRLSVKHPGYYYVFSQIKYRNTPLSPSNVDVSNDTTFSSESLPNHRDHFIYHRSRKNGSEKQILQSSKSRCETPSLQDETTSSVGAVFYLDKHDEVFVKTSHPQHIAPCQEGNHFGLYMT